MIRAEAHSDDRAVEVSFDATPYFEKVAGDMQILNIIKCGFRGDYPTDRIAQDYPDNGSETDRKLKELFKYVELSGRVRDMGFEVSVEEDDLLKWVKVNRPAIVQPIINHFNEFFQEGWDFPV